MAPPPNSTLHRIKGMLHMLFFFLILLPYYYIEALLMPLFKSGPKSVKGEIVLITGTGHGMGKLLASKYASQGATVVGWDINEELNSQTIEHINKSGNPKAYGYRVDVSNREDVMEAARKVKQEVGDVTILINNAGIMPHHQFLDHTEAEIRRIMDINVMAHFWTLQAFLPTMKKNNNGHVVCLSSMAGLLGLINLVPYNASKFAVRGLMDGLQAEFRKYPNNRVRFTTIYPYMVDTGLCKSVDITYNNMGRMLKPEYVVKKIFEAQTNDKEHVCVPPAVGVLVKFRIRFMPERARNYLTDNFKADLLSDLDLQTNGSTN